MGAHRLAPLGIILSLLASASSAQACLWDSDTLLQERFTSPKMAAAVLDAPPKPDTGRLRERIKTLRAAPREADPSWWNDLAGAHLRLGELETAVTLLEPAVRRFPNDYGVHANLGTAYHLLKRYPEAEREIARDLELNPDAHFGLERYHLALLQYLIRDPAYRARHVYVDEWTEPFLAGMSPRLYDPQKMLPHSAVNSYVAAATYDGSQPRTLAQELAHARTEWKASVGKSPNERDGYQRRIEILEALSDRPSGYRYRWDLARDPKFAEGVLYMASLNRAEPACWVMLGIACIDHSDLNLASAAFRRAIDLGSPQAPVLKKQVELIRRHQLESGPFGWITVGLISALAALSLFLLFRIVRRIRRWVVRRNPGSKSTTPAL